MDAIAIELEGLRRERDMLRIERDHYFKCVCWYAAPENWTPMHDDRGRETFTFRWGDDGGYMARASLARFGPNA